MADYSREQLDQSARKSAGRRFSDYTEKPGQRGDGPEGGIQHQRLSLVRRCPARTVAGSSPTMISEKFSRVVVAVLAIGGITVTLAVRDWAGTALRKKEAVLRVQTGALNELIAECARLTILMNDATNAPNIAAADYATESAKLTAEAQALKNRIDELRRDLAEASQVRHDQTASMSNYNADSRIRKVVSENTSAEYRLRLYSIGTADP